MVDQGTGGWATHDASREERADGSVECQLLRNPYHLLVGSVSLRSPFFRFSLFIPSELRGEQLERAALGGFPSIALA
jgi:hypothetical protein